MSDTPTMSANAIPKENIGIPPLHSAGMNQRQQTGGSQFPILTSVTKTRLAPLHGTTNGSFRSIIGRIDFLRLSRKQKQNHLRINSGRNEKNISFLILHNSTKEHP
jgi:hypothetical protein